MTRTLAHLLLLCALIALPHAAWGQCCCDACGHDDSLPGRIAEMFGLEPFDPEADSIVTDRPDFTEASSTVGSGVVQLESGYTFFYNDSEPDGTLTRAHSAPEALWRIGISENVELRVAWSFLWERTIEDGVAENVDGALDLYLGTKLALTEQREWIPESAVVFQSFVPTGADAFSNHMATFGINYLYSWDLPNGWSVGGSSGFDTSNELVEMTIPLVGLVEGEDRHIVFHQSATVGIPITDRLGMYVEYFGLYTHGRATNPPANFVDGGFTFLLNNDVQLDFRVGKGLNDHADDLFSGAGLSMRW